MEYLYAILPWILIFGIFWFFLIRPQQKQKKEHQKMLDELTIGDKVVTIGGIKGKIIKIKDNNVRIRVSSNVDIDFVKNAISKMEEKNSSKKKEKKEEKNKEEE
ncbi:preprotein translocase subunit YajC [Halanaerobium praevalens]|uniref:Preprotein translocase, YajC subunit n=1 Tax=Halanaerobium praevalens (strain ATCC 33744 / DSM 2228 / GSL) TaxID=572479 RepID=E3DQD8_HALPG|nr:preprotein translocase subunit YajC [Halanaerobium praevalens]ADO76834.1 preprotein translocase, YajC subunit [Halanaerobium praevalens DSM 2228]